VASAIWIGPENLTRINVKLRKPISQSRERDDRHRVVILYSPAAKNCLF